MTASAQLGGRPLAGTEKVLPHDAGSMRPAALIRPLSAPPAPVPPITPPEPGRPVTDLPLRRVPVPPKRAVKAAPSPALRFSRGARLVAAATVALAVVAGLGFAGQSTARPGTPAETTMIRVGAGETVWDVARRVAPQSNQRAVVERIRQLNDLVGSAVAPGQDLLVPDGRRQGS